jgi:hypothetical protein
MKDREIRCCGIAAKEVTMSGHLIICQSGNNEMYSRSTAMNS